MRCDATRCDAMRRDAMQGRHRALSRNVTLYTAHANAPQFPRGWLFMHIHGNIRPEKPPTRCSFITIAHDEIVDFDPSNPGTATFLYQWSMIKPTRRSRSSSLIPSCTHYVFVSRDMHTCNRCFVLCSKTWISYSLFDMKRRIYSVYLQLSLVWGKCV